MNRFSKAQQINNQIKPGQEFQDLDITKVYPNLDNPRKSFDPIKLQELSKSIVEHGLMQPIAVKQTEQGFIIYAGERRFKAHQLANLPTIKAHILESDNIQELALIENIQREDLTDYETAISIKALLDTHKYPKKQDLADAIGKTSQYVSKSLRVLNLDDEVQEEISSSNDKISTSVMIEISKQPKEKQKTVLKEYNQGNIKRDDINKAAEVLPMSKFKKVFEKEAFYSDSCQMMKAICSGVEEEDFKLYTSSDDIKADKRYKITIEEI